MSDKTFNQVFTAICSLIAFSIAQFHFKEGLIFSLATMLVPWLLVVMVRLAWHGGETSVVVLNQMEELRKFKADCEKAGAQNLVIPAVSEKLKAVLRAYYQEQAGNFARARQGYEYLPLSLHIPYYGEMVRYDGRRKVLVHVRKEEDVLREWDLEVAEDVAVLLRCLAAMNDLQGSSERQIAEMKAIM